jgi:hypothetical protein
MSYQCLARLDYYKEQVMIVVNDILLTHYIPISLAKSIKSKLVFFVIFVLLSGKKNNMLRIFINIHRSSVITKYYICINFLYRNFTSTSISIYHLLRFRTAVARCFVERMSCISTSFDSIASSTIVILC